MKIVAIILVGLFSLALYALLTAASKADDHAETMRNSKEEK
jgi:hypothetical protein